jgi:hypothetical protein
MAPKTEDEREQNPRVSTDAAVPAREGETGQRAGAGTASSRSSVVSRVKITIIEESMMLGRPQAKQKEKGGGKIGSTTLLQNRQKSRIARIK